MANWANTAYAVEGPIETLRKIEDAILHPDIEEGSTEGWEGNVLRALNIKWESCKPDGNGYYMRGFIQDEPHWTDEDHTALRFYAEEAWGITDFYKVLEKNLPVKVYFTVEEEGMEIYATNDKEGKYFPERYYVDACIDGNWDSDYFITEDSVFVWLSRRTNGEVKDMDSAGKWIDRHEEEDDENYIIIHEFEICD